MKFFLATKNKDKMTEFRRILSPLGIEVVGEGDLGTDLPDVEETGTTFAENAFIKAQAACDALGIPAIADDSGICVDALGGAPGVYSARYAGEHGNNELNNQKLLHELQGVADEQRGAHYMCAICCCFPDGRRLTTEGKCFGKIGYAPQGSGGFGYDPLFWCGDKTVAEMTAEEKDAISHRGKALRDFARQIEQYL